jgi:glycosyltransferase involved in cell wall biosynthesis
VVPGRRTMIKVAFVIPADFKQWMGGVNYFRNLLYAIHSMPDRRIEPVLFTGNKFDPVLLGDFVPVKIVQTKLLDKFDPTWVGRMLTRELTSTDRLMERELKQNDISVVSHYSGYLGTKTSMRVLGWIPDFQHIHYPEYFSKKELRSRNRVFREIGAVSTCVLLSSHTAREDFCTFAPDLCGKARVLQFVSQPNPAAQNPATSTALEKKYEKYNKYFFLPNQFWKHKNHKVVFEAVKILKDRNCDVIVLCSGSMNDYRNVDHGKELLEYIRVNNLGENIRILGMIDSADVFYLMRNCVSTLNPSFFEGWSTTVEEAKSLGKNMILSDIPVHREQDPPGSTFFHPPNAQELAAILCRKYDEGHGGPDLALERTAGERLRDRTMQFAANYQNIILEIAP